MATFGDNHDYPATVERLFSLFGRAAFWHDKYAAMGDQAIEIVECAPGDGGSLRIRTRREIPLSVPRIARKVIGEVNRVVTCDEWAPPVDGPAGSERPGTWSVRIIGRPVQLSGTMRLVPRDGGCTNVISGTIAVAVPLVGGAVERLLVGSATRALAKEHRFTRDYLQRELSQTVG